MGCTGTSLPHRLSLVATLRCPMQASHWAGFSSCGAWAKLPRGMWDLSCPAMDQISIPCTERQTSNHWTTREVPVACFKTTKASVNRVIKLRETFNFVESQSISTKVMSIAIQLLRVKCMELHYLLFQSSP